MMEQASSDIRRRCRLAVARDLSIGVLLLGGSLTMPIPGAVLMLAGIYLSTKQDVNRIADNSDQPHHAGSRAAYRRALAAGLPASIWTVRLLMLLVVAMCAASVYIVVFVHTGWGWRM